MMGTERTQLLASERMANQHRLFDFELIHHCQHIVRESLRREAARRVGGSSEAASRNSVDVVTTGKFRGEVIPNVGRIAETGEEYKRPSLTTPVEHFQLDALVDRNHLSMVW